MGAYIDQFEIDLLRYKIQPKEAERLQPQQALLLKAADNAIKDAGLDENKNVAVLVAMDTELAIHQCLARWDVEWQIEDALKNTDLDLEKSSISELIDITKKAIYHRQGAPTPSEFTSFIGNLIACRISSLWDFSGPAFTVSCTENSVFKALEIAQNLLSLGEVDAVVVGAVDFAGGLENVLLRQKENPSKHTINPSTLFSTNSNNWLIGEGAGAVVLKKHKSDSSDKVYAVIDEIGSWKTGNSIDYLELAATGIVTQNQFEQNQLLKKKPKNSVALGTIKANFGNCFAASGMASLIKTALCMYYRFIPGIADWSAPENKAFQKTNYYFPTESRPWILAKGQNERKASINGVGDIQIQLSLDQGKSYQGFGFLQTQLPNLFILTGNSAEHLLNQLDLLNSQIQNGHELLTIAATLHDTFCQQKSKYTIVLVAKDQISLQKEIEVFQKN
ncbi:beta-ketoacyl synthase N-terminal-like domain-containing protein [Algoriphagus halophilus]|uniref:beta-ketoacyl synthase N-terminal-like domain-containing protein n=1 Tax=Algoriphagus halophilus TaxID=226505 RepID=UPI00358E7914